MDQGEWFLAPEHIRRVIAAAAPEAFRESMLKGYEESGWFAVPPGVNPISLALCVVSDRFADWFLANPRSEEDVELIRQLREMPEEEALERIRLTSPW